MTDLFEKTRNDTPALAELRRDLNRHSELGLQEVRTSDIVAAELFLFGFRVHRGLAKTGIVANLSNGTSRRSIGLRVDMDALPIQEETELAYVAELVLDVRSFESSTRDFTQSRITEIAEGQARGYGLEAKMGYRRTYDATINHSAETARICALATRFAGADNADNVVEMARPSMGR